MKNISSCLCLCSNLSVVSQAGRFLSVPRYPGQLLGKGTTTQTAQERKGRCKGWEQVVLDLPFPAGLVMVGGGRLSTEESFHSESLCMALSILQYCFKHGRVKEIQIFVSPAASPGPLNRGAEHEKAELGGCQGLHCSETQQELLQ